MGLSLFVNLLALAVPVFTMQVYDRVVFQGGLSTLHGLLIGMIGVLGVDYILMLDVSGSHDALRTFGVEIMPEFAEPRPKTAANQRINP